MAWWGKIVGGTFGFMLGGPIGAVFGAAFGHNFDKGVAQNYSTMAGGSPSQEHIQAAFFTATFSVMGHIAKADGRVSKDEIALTDKIIRQMALNPEQTRVARELFSQGKQAGFDLDGVIAQFQQACHRRQTLMQLFIEIQLQAAYADDSVHPEEASILSNIARQLGFSRHQLDQLAALIRAQRDGGYGQPGRTVLHPNEAYAILDVNENATDAEVKKAYRRLMSQHHPDKLVAKGLPEEMIQVATAKTQEIRASYDAVMAARSSKLH